MTPPVPSAPPATGLPLPDGDDTTVQATLALGAEAVRAADAPTTAHGPRQAGRYQIRECLGSGGMGTVFKAHDPDIGRDVAIKFLHPSLCDAGEARARFLREARAAGRLSHPNIVTVHDVGEIGGRPYMAMELLDGRTLASELSGGGAPLAAREAVAVGIQLARALDYAHARGVVHRDIKPANIVRLDGVPSIKVTDFGIAHMEASGAEQATRAGALIGTPQYMSPEQARGERLDGRSDLFSVGIVLYEMLAGRRPFDGDGMLAAAMNIVAAEPTPLGTLRSDLPASLRRVVERCLAKAPQDRFGSGVELAGALERVLAELEAGGPPRAGLRPLPLGLKPVAAAALVAALLMATTTAFVARGQYAVLRGQAIDAGAAMARLIATQNAVPALAEDWNAVEVSVQRAMKTPGVVAVVVIDRGGTVRAAGDPALVGRPYRQPQPDQPIAGGDDGVLVSRRDDAGGAVLGFQVPITFQGVAVGSVALGLSQEPLARAVRRSMALLVPLALAGVLAAAVAAAFVAHRLARPIGLLRAALGEIGRGRLYHRVGHRGDAFGPVYAAFDEMAQSLQEGQRRGRTGAARQAEAPTIAVAAPPGSAAPTVAVAPPPGSPGLNSSAT